MTKSKMMVGIEQAVELIKEGEYTVENGNLFNKAGKQIGSLDKPSGNIFYVIKKIDILAQRLMYAYYNGGADALKEGEVVTHLDGNKQNNTADNLVQLARKGMKAELARLRSEKGIEVAETVKAPAKPKAKKVAKIKAVDSGMVHTVAQAPQAQQTEEYTEAEKTALAVWDLIKAGKTTKEITETLDVKPQWVRDVKRGKTAKRVTKPLAEAYQA